MPRRIVVVVAVLMASLVNANEKGITSVLIDQSEPAYTVYTGITQKTEVKAKALAQEQGLELIPWAELHDNTSKYVGA